FIAMATQYKGRAGGAAKRERAGPQEWERAAWGSGLRPVRLSAREGYVVPVGRTIAVIAEQPGATVSVAASAPAAAAASASTASVKASPLARKPAEQHGIDIAKISYRLSPSGITGRDLREPFLHHRRDERAVAREHAAARDRTTARARRHVLRVEQPLVDAERSMKPHAVASQLAHGFYACRRVWRALPVFAM